MGKTGHFGPPSNSPPAGLFDRLWSRPRKAGAQDTPGFKCVAQHILVAILSLLLVMPPEGTRGAEPAPGPAPGVAGTQASATKFSPDQLDAMLAPIALYPDDLLVQTLMAATYPLQIVEATRWLERDHHKALKGDALAQALAPLPWDPSVKSLVPFPQVLEQLNQNLDWTQQIGYAMATQQEDVLDSVQRLRRQAQKAGHLNTTEQQVVSTQATVDDQGQPTPDPTIVIQPADPQVVYVPSYNPSAVYGTWPYPAYPPVSYPPPASYYPGAALATGMAFAAGVAVVGSLWGWAGASWGHGGGARTGQNRQAGRTGGTGTGGANRPNIGTANRPNGSNIGGARTEQSRPAGRTAGAGTGAANRANTGASRGGQRPQQRPARQPTQRANSNRGGAFGGMNDGARARQFQQRGSQSRALQSRGARGGARGGGRRR